jgi:hypothetical protein
MNFTPLDIIPDVSFWQDDNSTVQKIDFVKMRTQTQGVIIRAGQNTWIDSDVVWNWQVAKEAGLRRGSYWFYDSRSSPQSQAELWKAALGNDLPELGLWCDLEENYGGTYQGEANWKKFTETVRVQFPNTKIGIYTGYGWWNAQTVSQVDYWSSFPLWLAWYTTFPETVILPLPWKTKGATLWQNTDKGDGRKYGAESLNIDLSYTSSAFYNLFGGAPPPPPADIITTPLVGVTRISGKRYGLQFELFVSDPSKVRYELVCLSPLETVSSVVRRKGAQIGINGGEWDRVSKPKDYTVSKGYECHSRVEAVPSLLVYASGSVAIEHQYKTGVVHALSGLRYLMEGGVIKSYLDGSEPQYTEGHARSVHCVNAQGYHMVMQSTGVYPNQGLTLKQCAEVMKQYGAVKAFDSGGGGDVTCILNGQSLIVPENIYNGQHFERALPAVFLIYAQEADMTLGRAKEKLGKTPKIRTSPHLPAVGEVDNWTGETIPALSEITFEAIVDDTNHPGQANYKWFRIATGRYTAYKYPLTDTTQPPDRFTVLSMPTEPPPPTVPDLPVKIELGDDVTYIKQVVNIVLKGKA